MGEAGSLPRGCLAAMGFGGSLCLFARRGELKTRRLVSATTRRTDNPGHCPQPQNPAPETSAGCCPVVPPPHPGLPMPGARPSLALPATPSLWRPRDSSSVRSGGSPPGPWGTWAAMYRVLSGSPRLRPPPGTHSLLSHLPQGSCPYMASPCSPLSSAPLYTAPSPPPQPSIPGGPPITNANCLHLSPVDSK